MDFVTQEISFILDVQGALSLSVGSVMSITATHLSVALVRDSAGVWSTTFYGACEAQGEGWGPRSFELKGELTQGQNIKLTGRAASGRPPPRVAPLRKWPNRASGPTAQVVQPRQRPPPHGRPPPASGPASQVTQPRRWPNWRMVSSAIDF